MARVTRQKPPVRKERLIEIRFNRRLWEKSRKNVLIFMIEFFIGLTTVLAFFYLLGSIVAMVESWFESGSSSVLFFVSLGWLILFNIYIYLVNR